jgi:hypothetical protein
MPQARAPAVPLQSSDDLGPDSAEPPVTLSQVALIFSGVSGARTDEIAGTAANLQASHRLRLRVQ